MTITAADLLAPQGPVAQTLFPGVGRVELLADFAVYVSRAYGDARVVALIDDDARYDAGARALALFFAYDAVYNRMLGEPLTVSVAEKGSHGYSTAQIAGIAAIRDGYLAELVALEPAPATSVDVGTRGVRTRFVW